MLPVIISLKILKLCVGAIIVRRTAGGIAAVGHPRILWSLAEGLTAVERRDLLPLLPVMDHPLVGVVEVCKVAGTPLVGRGRGM